MKILETKHLKKYYGTGENQVKAVDDITLQVEKGEFVAIVGTSGSGKTTLLNLMGGLDYADSGEVIVDGQSLLNMNEEERTVFRRRKIGFIFQNYNLISMLNVYKNVTLPIRLDGNKPDQEFVKRVLDVLGLKGKEERRPNQLSGGQQQRVSIGRALMNAPAIVLADEPTGNLDSKNSQEIMQLLRYSNEKYNQTMLVITHDENIALQADRILSLEDGRIVKDEVIRR